MEKPNFKKMCLMYIQQLTNFPYIEKDFDALTDYQLLCKVVAYLNKIITNENTQNETITALYNAFVELKDYVDNYFDNLDVQDEVNNKLEEMLENGELPEIIEETLINKLNNYSDSNEASTSENLLTNSTLWALNDGWTGNYEYGFSHIVGQSANLEYNYDFDGNKNYILSFNVTSASGPGENASCAFTCQIGNSNFPIMYRGGGSMHYEVGIKSINAGHLKFLCVNPSDPFTPSGIFDGTISNIKLKEVTAPITQLEILDSDDNESLSFTITKNNRNNVAIGNEAMINSVSGDGNVYIGKEAGKNSVASFYNVGIGYKALSKNVQGSRNVAIGFNTLQNIESADRNIAIGGFCMNDNVSGRKNIAIGFDTLQHLTSGQDNMAIGNQSLGTTTSANGVIAIGSQAMLNALPTGSNILAIGNLALRRLTSGSNNIAIGNNTLYRTTTGQQLIAIGPNALNNNETGSRTIAIGNNALQNFTSGQWNVAIGLNNSTTLTTMNNSTLIGCGNVSKINELNNAILIGSNISGITNHETFEDVVVINSGATVRNVEHDHRTIIQNALFIDTSDTSKKIGIQIESPTAKLHISSSNGSAGTAPIKLNSGTLMTTPENGAFEFDGTHLYFTIGNARKTIV